LALYLSVLHLGSGRLIPAILVVLHPRIIYLQKISSADQLHDIIIPAIEIDGTVVFRGCAVSRDQLEEAIRGKQR